MKESSDRYNNYNIILIKYIINCFVFTQNWRNTKNSDQSMETISSSNRLIWILSGSELLVYCFWGFFKTFFLRTFLSYWMALKVESGVIPFQLSPCLWLFCGLVFGTVTVFVITTAIVWAVAVFLLVVYLLALLLFYLLFLMKKLGFNQQNILVTFQLTIN